jgi:hypothetical protein
MSKNYCISALKPRSIYTFSNGLLYFTITKILNILESQITVLKKVRNFHQQIVFKTTLYPEPGFGLTIS